MFKYSIQRYKSINLTIILLLIVNSLFFLYYCILAIYNRPHFDDLHFFWKLKTMSVSEYVNDMYFDRSGRFMSYFLNAIIYKTSLFIDNYKYFPILFGIIGFGFFWLFIKSIFITTSRFLLLYASILFYNLYILTNIDFSVFYWLCAMFYYLLMPMLLLVLLYINKKHISLIQKISLIICTVFLGGGHEGFTLIVLTALIFNILYYYKIQNYKFNIFFRTKEIIKTMGLIIILLFCYMIVIIAPGNYLRLSLDEFIIPHNIYDFLKGLISAIASFYYYFIFYFPYYIILSLVVVNVYLKSNYVQYKSKYNYKQLGLSVLYIYIVYVFISVFPSVMLWSGFGIERNYTHLVFTSMIFILLQTILFVHFHQNIINKKIIVILQNLGLISLIVIMIINILNDSGTAQKYAKSVDNRIEKIISLNKNGLKQNITVNPLYVPYTIDSKAFILGIFRVKPPTIPVLYYMSDTDYEPNEYAYHLSKFYNLNFEIVLRNNKKIISE